MLISIIIPVFNAAAYLETCVASLRALPIPMEIGMVDDGSTDGSDRLCDKLGDKVLHQDNQGVSAARNAGMKLAAGDWLWFVDADDRALFLPSLEERDLNHLVNADLVVTGFVWEENGEARQFGALASEIPYNLWRCWFRNNLVEGKKIRFTEGRKYAEDQEFILKYLLTLRKYTVFALPEVVYYYTVRPGSAITRKGVKMKQIKDILGVTASLWMSAIQFGNVPTWIWAQTKRLIKTAIVSACKM